MFRLGYVLLLALLLALAPRTAFAQAKAAAAAPAAATAKVPAEEEVSDSPRISMRRFQELAQWGRWSEAALYLDLPRGQEKRGAELANRLYTVLLQRLVVDPEQLSPNAQGKTTDGLAAGVEELGRIRDAKGRSIPIRIVRYEPKDPHEEPRWVFSQSTVSQVDTLYTELDDGWVRERLPPSLLKLGPFGLHLWQWLALPVLAVLSAVAGRLLTWLSGIVARAVLHRQGWAAKLLPRLKRPVIFAWALIVFWFLLRYLALALRAEDTLVRVVHASLYLALFWALIRAVTVGGDLFIEGDWARTRPTARTLTFVGVRLGKLVVGALALMVALSQLGYPATSVVAGLGIGGVALALAAQKTVENLFGSISILADQPFHVGDTIRVDGVEGTVESIGLRSTRMRTVDRTLVVMPNGKLADMRIESLGERDLIRFATKLSIARTTSPEKLRALAKALKIKLAEHEKVRKVDVAVRFGGLGESSYDLDVSAPVETVDAREFADVKQDLLFACVEEVSKAGVELAAPPTATPAKEARS